MADVITITPVSPVVAEEEDRGHVAAPDFDKILGSGNRGISPENTDIRGGQKHTESSSISSKQCCAYTDKDFA